VEFATPDSPMQPAPRAGGDPFPTDRFAALVRRFPAYARLAWRLSRDERLTRGRRAAVLGAAAYLASPIDLVPGIIPFAGQLDDAAVALLGLRFTLRGLPPEVRAEHLGAVAIAEDDLDRDLVTVRQGAGWLARRGGKLALRGGRAMGRTAWRLARGAARGAVRRIR
jgi:uncharacterized membrane protein YkvA (DUF1232 family)